MHRTHHTARRATLFVSLLMASTASARGGGGFSADSGQLIVSAHCNSRDFVNTRRGLAELDAAEAGEGRCAEICAGEPIAVDRCRDDVWLSSICGRLEVRRWNANALFESGQSRLRSAPYSVCYENPAPTDGRKRVRLPADIDRSRPVVWAEVQDYDGVRRFEGMATSYQGLRRAYTAALGGGGAPLQSITPGPFEGNGTAVASCAEYVYEKYNDYSLYEDRVAELGGDQRAAFDAAFENAPPADVLSVEAWCAGNRIPDHAIGTKALCGQPLTALDGAPLSPQPTLDAAASLRNPVFAGRFNHPPEDPVDIEITYHLGGGLMVEDAYYADVGECGVWLYDPIICDAELLALMEAARAEGPTHVTKSWAWHRRKGEALEAAGIVDEDLHAIQRFLSAFEQLLYQRGMLARDLYTIDSIAADPDDIHQETRQVFDPSVAMAGDAIGTRLAAQKLYKAQPQALAMVDPMAPAPGELQLDADGLIAVPVPMTVAHRARLERLASLDAQIEAALKRAVGLGCFRTGDDNPCDWTPRHFAEQVMGLYAAVREADYQQCTDVTAQDGFQMMVHKSLDANLIEGNEAIYPRIDVHGQSLGCWVLPDGTMEASALPSVDDPTNAWQSSTTLVERFLRCYPLFEELLDEQLEATIGGGIPVGGGVLLGEQHSDSWQEGDDSFGLEARYGFGWALGRFFIQDTPEADSCDLSPEAYGYFDVDAYVFGQRASMVDASAHARAGDDSALTLPDEVVPHSLDIRLLGMDLVSASTEDFATEFSLVEDGASLMYVLGELSIAVASVGPFTVNIDAGVVGFAGMQASVEGGLPTGHQQAGCDLITLDAELRPYAGIDGFVGVSAGIGIIDVGVELLLTLIEVALPFEAGLALELTDGTLALSVDLSLDFVLTLLSGGIYYYVDALFGAVELYRTPIAEWDGFIHVVNLWSGSPLSFDLADLD